MIAAFGMCAEAALGSEHCHKVMHLVLLFIPLILCLALSLQLAALMQQTRNASLNEQQHFVARAVHGCQDIAIMTLRKSLLRVL
jgi:hypothetical protein